MTECSLHMMVKCLRSTALFIGYSKSLSSMTELKVDCSNQP